MKMSLAKATTICALMSLMLSSFHLAATQHKAQASSTLLIVHPDGQLESLVINVNKKNQPQSDKFATVVDYPWLYIPAQPQSSEQLVITNKETSLFEVTSVLNDKIQQWLN